MSTFTSKPRAAGVAALVVAVLGCLLLPTGASAAANGIAVGVFPQFPTRVDLGASNVAASVNVINGSSGAQATGTVTVTELTLVPSCGNFTPTCAGGADPGVFRLSATGTGAAGTGCAGDGFAITVIDAGTGRVRIAPSDGSPLVLAATDMTTELDTCLITFTLSNLRMPTIDSYPDLGESQTNQVGFMSVRHADGSTGNDQGEDVTTVVPGTPPPTTTTTTTTVPPTTTTTCPPTTTTTRPPTTTTTTTTTRPPTTTTTRPPTTTTTTTTRPPTTTTTTTTTRPPTTTTTTTTTRPPTTTTTRPPTTTTTTTVPAPPREARFVDRAYRDLFGRAPQAWETAYWIDAMAKGKTRAYVATAMTTSSEFRKVVVGSYYTGLLGRPPTANESGALVDAIAGGWPFEYAQTVVLGSDEFYARHGATAGGYVNALYAAVLGLAPDAAGRAFWIDQLTNQGLDRYEVALAFTTHSITHHRLASAASHWLLRRAPTAAETSAWAGQLDNGVRQESLFASLVASDEYWAKV